jgi:integrase
MIVDIASLTPQQLVCPPGQRRIEYVDKGGLGLYLEVRASSPGVATAYVRYKGKDGRSAHQRIGSTAVLSVPEIRREAKRIKAEITLGADPRAEARARKVVPTFNDFFENHYMPYVRPRKRSAKRDSELFRLHVAPTLGTTRLDRVTLQHVQGILTGMTARGLAPGSADLVGRFVRHALNLGMDWKFIEVNPTARLPMFNVDSRVAHYMDDAQLEALLHVLRTDRNRAVCRVATFLLSTGCRLNEALSATWADVDVERRVFAIRATNSKSRKLRSVPLNDSAIDVLTQLETRDAGGPLFRGHRGEPLRYVAKSWGRIRRAAGLPHLRLHDLRHQFASFLVNDGRTLYEVQAILGHSSSKVTERYAHLSTKTLQDAANSASARLNGVKSNG